MAMNPSAEGCLSNMAALLILIDFDNILCFVFDIRINKKYPKLYMADDRLKDEFNLHSYFVASAFTTIFLVFIIIYVINDYLVFQVNCKYKDQIFEQIFNEAHLSLEMIEKV